MESLQRWAERIGKRRLVVLGVILAIAIVAYWGIIPTVVANYYLGNLDRELIKAKTALYKVSSATSLPMFSDPDVSLADREKQIKTLIADIKEARQALDSLGHQPRLATLPGSGMVRGYRVAKVKQGRAQTARLQAKQSLIQYAQVLEFLQAYTGLQLKLDSYLNSVNTVNNFNALRGYNSGLASTAQLIRADERFLESLQTPIDFAELHSEAEKTFSQAAAGFESLNLGLRQYSDWRIYGSVRQLEAATLKNQVADKDLLVALADKSPILRQVAELPEKVDHAQLR